MQIIVASQNPVKVRAALQGFEKMFAAESIQAEGISVPSGVPDQPMSQAETLQGARNRAVAAKQARPEADYWIGIEGGLEETAVGMEVFAWVVILSGDRQGQARTATFMLPSAIIELIHQGYELGEADDRIFGVHNSKQAGGALGLLTHNVVDRSWFYVPAVVLALLPFLNEDLYPA